MNSSEFLNEDLTVLLCWESWLVSRTGLVVLSDGLQSLLCILSLSGPWKSFAGWPPSLACHSVLWQLLVCPPPLGPPLFPLLCPLSASQSSTSTKACGSSSHFNVSGTMTVPCLLVSLENRQPFWLTAGEEIQGSVRLGLLTPVKQIIIIHEPTSSDSSIIPPVDASMHRHTVHW